MCVFVCFSGGAQTNFDDSCWTDVKYTLGLDFPNLPYMFDSSNNCKLSQSGAILRYIARKADLLGKDDVQKGK